MSEKNATNTAPKTTEETPKVAAVEASALAKLKGYLGAESRSAAQVAVDLKAARADLISEGADFKAHSLRLLTEDDVKFNTRGQRLPYYVAGTAVVATAAGFGAATLMSRRANAIDVADVNNITPIAQTAGNR